MFKGLDWEICIRDSDDYQRVAELLERKTQERDHHHRQVLSSGGILDSEETVLDRYIVYLKNLIEMWPNLRNLVGASA